MAPLHPRAAPPKLLPPPLPRRSPHSARLRLLPLLEAHKSGAQFPHPVIETLILQTKLLSLDESDPTTAPAVRTRHWTAASQHQTENPTEEAAAMPSTPSRSEYTYWPTRDGSRRRRKREISMPGPSAQPTQDPWSFPGGANLPVDSQQQPTSGQDHSPFPTTIVVATSSAPQRTSVEDHSTSPTTLAPAPAATSSAPAPQRTFRVTSAGSPSHLKDGVPERVGRIGGNLRANRENPKVGSGPVMGLFKTSPPQSETNAVRGTPPAKSEIPQTLNIDRRVTRSGRSYGKAQGKMPATDNLRTAPRSEVKVSAQGSPTVVQDEDSFSTEDEEEEEEDPLDRIRADRYALNFGMPRAAKKATVGLKVGRLLFPRAGNAASQPAVASDPDDLFVSQPAPAFDSPAPRPAPNPLAQFFGGIDPNELIDFIDDYDPSIAISMDEVPGSPRLPGEAGNLGYGFNGLFDALSGESESDASLMDAPFEYGDDEDDEQGIHPAFFQDPDYQHTNPYQQQLYQQQFYEEQIHQQQAQQYAAHQQRIDEQHQQYLRQLGYNHLGYAHRGYVQPDYHQNFLQQEQNNQHALPVRPARPEQFLDPFAADLFQSAFDEAVGIPNYRTHPSQFVWHAHYGPGSQTRFNNTPLAANQPENWRPEGHGNNQAGTSITDAQGSQVGSILEPAPSSHSSTVPQGSNLGTTTDTSLNGTNGATTTTNSGSILGLVTNTSSSSVLRTTMNLNSGSILQTAAGSSSSSALQPAATADPSTISQHSILRTITNTSSTGIPKDSVLDGLLHLATAAKHNPTLDDSTFEEGASDSEEVSMQGEELFWHYIDFFIALAHDKVIKAHFREKQMMYVSGETGEPSVETTGIIEDIVRQQVVEILRSCTEHAARRGSRSITINDLIFQIRDDAPKVSRLRTFLSWKDVRKNVKDSDDKGGEADIGGGEDPGGVVPGGPVDDAAKKNKKARVGLPWEPLSFYNVEVPEREDEEDEEEEEMNYITLQRLRKADERTKAMTREEYVTWSEFRQASFTYRKGKRFREWAGFGLVTDSKPSDDIVDILGFLTFEMVQTLTEEALKIKDNEDLRKDTGETAGTKKRKLAQGLFDPPSEGRTPVEPRHIQEAFRRLQQRPKKFRAMLNGTRQQQHTNLKLF